MSDYIDPLNRLRHRESSGSRRQQDHGEFAGAASGRSEAERNPVHEVPHAGQLRVVVEQVAKVPASAAARHLGARHVHCAVLLSSTASSIACQKLGHPVPLSNLVVEENRSRAHPAQVKMPASCSSSSGLLKGCSVPAVRSTLYCSGVRSCCHSASVWETSIISSEVSGVPAAVVSRGEPQPASAPSSRVPRSKLRRDRAADCRGGVGPDILRTSGCRIRDGWGGSFVSNR